MFVCLLIAQFLAYRNTVRNLYTVIDEKRDFSIRVNALNSTVASQKAIIEQLNSSGNKRPIIVGAIDKNGHPDRLLNAEQQDHLYQELKRVSDDPRQKDHLTVTIAAAYRHDRESSRLAVQLDQVFQDAHWYVVGQRTVDYEQQTQGQIPIGIWVTEPPSNNMALFVEGSLINAGLTANTQPNYPLPTGFKGVLILVGYKDAPF